MSLGEFPPLDHLVRDGLAYDEKHFLLALLQDEWWRCNGERERETTTYKADEWLRRQQTIETIQTKLKAVL